MQLQLQNANVLAHAAIPARSTDYICFLDLPIKDPIDPTATTKSLKACMQPLFAPFLLLFPLFYFLDFSTLFTSPLLDSFAPLSSLLCSPHFSALFILLLHTTAFNFLWLGCISDVSLKISVDTEI